MTGSLEMAAALLLACAGLAKLVAPAPATAMLRRAWPRLAATTATVRAAGAGEFALGLLVLVVGDRMSALVMGACYAGFTAVAVRLLRRGRHDSCGCFGRADSPVGAAHLVLNGVCLGAAAAAFVRPPGRFGGLFDGGVLHGVVAAGQVALLTYLGFLSITALPALTAARRLLLESR
jgi:hypothetical protein